MCSEMHYSWCDDLYMGTKMRLLFGGYLSRNAIEDQIWGNRNRLQFLSNRNRLNDQK